MQTKKVLLVVALALCALLSLMACNVDDTPAVFTVTFDSRGGSEVAPIEVVSGSTIALPVNPTKVNHSFGGWYLDENLTNVFDASAAVNASITVYAKWTENPKYNISFVAGEGASGTAPTYESQYVGAVITLPANPFEKDNFVFGGWKDGTRTYNIGASYTVGSAAVVFEPNWKAETAREQFSFDPVDDTIITAYNGEASEVIIPHGVTRIGEDAFRSRIRVTSIIIPSSVTSIGNRAFNDCLRLTEVFNQSTLPITIGASDYGGIGLHLKNLYTVNGGSKLSKEGDLVLFKDGETVSIVEYTGTATEITIPNDVTAINTFGFYASTTLTSVTVPENVTTIGYSAFNGCSSLENLTLPFVGGAAKTPTDTHRYALGYIFGLAEYDGSISVQQDYYGESSSFVSRVYYSLPTTLRSVTITGGTHIPHGAFMSCSMLTNITLPDTITSIGEKAFQVCLNLLEIEIPNGVQTIGKNTFLSCYSLTSIKIPANITSIGDEAFVGCYKMVEIFNQSALPITAGSSDFGRIGEHAKNVYTTEGGSKLSTIADYLIYTDGDLVSLVQYQGTATELTIPDGVTEINAYCFYRPSNCTSITMPDSVTKIGEYAFQGNKSLKTVIIGENVTSIGNRAFSACYGLTTITIPANVTEISEFAFASTYRLVEIFNQSALPITAGSLDFGRIGEFTKNVYTTEGASKLSTTADGFLLYTDAVDVWIIDYLGESLDIVIADDVTGINAYALSMRNDLTSVTFPIGSTWTYDGHPIDVTDSSNNVYNLLLHNQVKAWTKG